MKVLIVLCLAVSALAARSSHVRHQNQRVQEREFQRWLLLIHAKNVNESDDVVAKTKEEDQWRSSFGSSRLSRVHQFKNNGRKNVRKLIRRGYADWESYKEYYGKVYTNESEENERMKMFLRAQQIVRKHNKAYKRGQKDFSLGLNNIADLLPEEYRRLNGFIGYDGDTVAMGNHTTFLTPLNANIPDDIDWRKSGYVTKVKNQGNCGSCWAFSTTGSLEGQHMRKMSQLVPLSEQNLMDCSKNYGNNGCNGGSSYKAFQYIKDNGGVDTETSYPYNGVDGQCRFKKESVGAVNTGVVNIPSGNEEKLKLAVATIGPVAVAIDASRDSFQHYRSDCSSKQLDHAVLVVGYGTDNGKDYWIVKNSWGDGWGMKGYLWMSRNRENNCGIATAANYPLV